MIRLLKTQKLLLLFVFFLSCNVILSVFSLLLDHQKVSFYLTIFEIIMQSIIGFGVPVFTVFAIANSKKIMRSFCLSCKINIKTLVLVVVLFIAFYPVINALHWFNDYLIQLLPDSVYVLSIHLKQAYASYIGSLFIKANTESFVDVALLFIAIAFIPSITEELFFRSGIQRLISKHISSKILAIIIAGCIFSLLHFEPSGFLVRWVLGCLLGYIFFLTNNICYAIILHFFNNAMACLELLMQEPENIVMSFTEHTTLLMPTVELEIILVLGGITISFFCIQYLRKIYRLLP